MKWLITGGVGFIGTNLAVNLSQKGHDVIVFDNFSRLGSEYNLLFLLNHHKRINILRGDIRNKSDLKKLFKENSPFDAIAHLAGQVSMIESINDPRRDFEINALGTFNVCEMVLDYCPKAVLLYTSTNKVYGDLASVPVIESSSRWKFKNLPSGVDESHPLSLHGPYSCSKGTGDQYVHDFSAIFGLRTVVFRMSTIYGPHQFATVSQGWISWFIERALENRPFTIHGDGKQVRDILYVDDLCEAFNAAAQSKAAWGKIFNIGGGVENSLSLLELFTILEKKLSVTLEYQKLETRPADQKVYISDSRSFLKVTGWYPKIDKEKGIDSQIDWIKRNDLNPSSHNGSLCQ